MYLVFYNGVNFAKTGSFQSAKMAINTHKLAYKVFDGYVIHHPDGTKTHH